jgi:hypothetical protein
MFLLGKIRMELKCHHNDVTGSDGLNIIYYFRYGHELGIVIHVLDMYIFDIIYLSGT